MTSVDRRRFGSVTPAQVRCLDSAATDLGVGVTQLMEVAGFQVARLAWRMLGSRSGRVHVVAGHGNNGGDGLVAARHLSAWGCTVSGGVLAAETQLGALLASQLAAARGAGVDITVTDTPDHVVGAAAADLVVDALLGVGLRQAPRAAAAAVINALPGPVLSVDVPSGLDAADGSAPGVAVTATATCTLGAVKTGLWERRSAPYVGRLFVADIAMPGTAWSACGLTAPAAVRGGSIRRVRRAWENDPESTHQPARSGQP